MSGRRTVTGAVAVVAASLVLGACASGDASSFTSLDAASAQARTWVDTAVTTAVPGASTAEGHAEGPDSCTTSADFAETSYSLSVDVPADQVDATTAAIWQSLRDQGFGAVVPAGSTGGTTPVPPGPGSPSWTLQLFHDGFSVEIIGARTSPTYVSTYIVTPCLAVS